MADRKYTVAEIDRMRAAVAYTYLGSGEQMIEERLRTYMLNGTEPDELDEAARPRREELARHRRVFRPGSVSWDWMA